MGNLIDLCPQALDVRVDRPIIAEIVVAPDTIQQIVAAEHLVLVCRQNPKQLDLFFREMDLVPGDLYDEFVQSDLQIFMDVEFMVILVVRCLIQPP